MRYLGLLFLFIINVSVAFAQADTEDFNIKVLIGSDVTPPSTPTLISAVPVSTSQIDLAWSTSTDDLAVSGYTVTRDGSVIATTSLLTFSDSGLSASTTYSYSIKAFDSALNYSTSSNSLATTTQSVVVVVPADPSSTEGTSARVVLSDLQIETGYSTSTFSVETSYFSRLEIRWGRSASYELGYLVGNVLKKQHVFPIDGLESGTRYAYEIVGYTPYGISSVLKSGFFTTKSNAPTASLSNVNRFTSLQNGFDVDLTWNNISDNDFAHVRIVQSHLGFPEHPTDGVIIYQGQSESTTDVGVLNIYSPVYYTAFAYDKFGNVSTGAVTMLYAAAEGASSSSAPSSDIKVPPVIVEATSTVDIERLTPEMKMPELNEIYVVQGSETSSLLDYPIALDSNQPFVVSVPVEAVTGSLKSIIVTVLDPTDTRKAYSYLLRINKDQTAYVTTVAPIDVLGKSQLKVKVYDYESYLVATYQAPIEFLYYSNKEDKDSSFFGLISDNFYYIVMVAGGFGLFWWILLRFLKRRTEDNG